MSDAKPAETKPPRKNPFIPTMKLEDFKPDQTILDQFCGKDAMEKALQKPPAPEIPRAK